MTRLDRATSPVVKRSIVIGGHKTSVSLEDLFWTSLKEIASRRSMTLSQLASELDATRGAQANLSSAIRVFVLAYYRDMTKPDGKGASAGAAAVTGSARL